MQRLANGALILGAAGDEFDASETFSTKARDFFRMEIVTETSQGTPLFRSLVIEECLSVRVAFCDPAQDRHLGKWSGGFAVDA
jgi:hypothetical protein